MSDNEERQNSKKRKVLRKRPEPGVVPLTHSEDDAALRAGCGASTIRRAINSGALAAHKLGRRTFIFDDDLCAWLRSMPARVPSGKAA